MQAPKYVESNKDVLRYRDYSLQLHQQKLQRIKDRNNRLDLSPSVMEKAAGQRLKTVGFLEAERQESIRRENEVLMAKLLSITEPKGNKRGVKSLEHRSLNTHQRKKEVERIRTENEAFSKRLQEKAAMLSKKRMDLDYIESQKYKRQISKAHLLKRQGRKVQLPPLQEAPVDLRVSSSQNALESSPSNQPRRSAHKQADEGLNKTYHYSLTVSHRDKSPRQKIGMTLDKYLSGKSTVPTTELNERKKTRTKKKPGDSTLEGETLPSKISIVTEEEGINTEFEPSGLATPRLPSELKNFGSVTERDRPQPPDEVDSQPEKPKNPDVQVEQIVHVAAPVNSSTGEVRDTIKE